MYYLGVDIHKDFCETTVMDEEGAIVETGKVPTRRESLRIFFARYRGSRAVIESTTIWEFVYETLESLGVDVTLANPSQVKAISHARAKPDKVDSRILAHLLRTDLVPACWVPPRDVRELRKDVRGRMRMKGLTTSLKNQLYAELVRRGIEYPEGLMGTKRGPRWVAERIPEPRVQRRATLLEALEAEVDGYNRDVLLPTYEARRDAQLLATIPGVGYYTALTAVAEIGDVRRFPDSDSLVSWAGLAPRVRQSGSVLRIGSISKEGSSILRWTLVEAVHSHRRHCPDKDACRLCRFHHRIARRRGKGKAAVAGAAKLLRIMYRMLTLNEPYRPQGRDPGNDRGGERRQSEWGHVPGRRAKTSHRAGKPRIR